MFNFSILTEDEINEASRLAGACFLKDKYFAYLGADGRVKFNELVSMFKKSITSCVRDKTAYCYKKSGEIQAVVLWCNYPELKKNHLDDYNYIFWCDCGEPLEKVKKVADTYIDKLLYLLSVYVAPEYRKQGIETEAIAKLLSEHKGWVCMSDVSNAKTIPMFNRFGFTTEELDTGYFLAINTGNN